MSETPPDSGEIPTVDFSGLTAEEIPPLIKPTAPADTPPSDAPQPLTETPSERVKRRLRSVAGGERGRGAEGSAESPDAPRPPRTGKPRKPLPPKPREGSLVKPLTDMYAGVGLMIAPFDPVCSTVVLQNAEQCAKSVEKLARENDAVRRVVTSLVETSAWGGLIMAHAPILAVIATHHAPKPIADRAAPIAMALTQETPGSEDESA